MLPLDAWLTANLGVGHRLALGPTAATALLLVPIGIVLLHLLKLRRTPHAVPSTLLWRRSLKETQTNRLLRRLRRNLLLVLQLLAALLLLLAVAGPSLHGTAADGRHYVLLIDNSASMGAMDVPPTRLAWAKAEAIRRIDTAGDADPGMVIAFSDAAEIRQSFTPDKVALRRAVEGIAPTLRPTRLDEALALAGSLANPLRSTENEVAAEGVRAEVHLYSDGKCPPVADFALGNLQLSLHAPPGGSDNLAVVRLEAERNPERPGEVFVQAGVRNYRPTPARVRVRLELLDGAGRLLALHRPEGGDAIELPAGGERADLRFTLPDVPEDAERSARLALEGADDALPADDVGHLVLGVGRRAKVMIVGPPNRRLRDFFDSPAARRLADTTYIESESPIGDSAAIDLVIFDRCRPASADAMPPTHTLFVGALPPGIAGAGPVQNPRVRGWDGQHPVMRGLPALDDILIAEAESVAEWPPRTRRLIEGDRNLVLLAGVSRGAFTDLVLTFPLTTDGDRWNTDWPLKLSFPLFLRNVVLALGGGPNSGAGPSVPPGSAVPLRLGGSACVVRKPGGGTVRLERGPRPEFLFAETDEVGVYVAEGAERRRFAVNLFDPLESDIAPAESVRVGGATIAAGPGRPEPRELWKWPAALAVLAAATEWWLYHRRGRV